MTIDLEDLAKNYEQFYDITRKFYNNYISNPEMTYDRLVKISLKGHKMNMVNKIELRKAYFSLIDLNELPYNKELDEMLVKKPGKSESGVNTVSYLTSPYPEWEDEEGVHVQEFSCKHDCYFCPNERDKNGKPIMPRSYLSNEPACLRASRNKFDPIEQIHDRLFSLENQGHPLDKVELIVLGGTVLEYPRGYLEDFITKSFYICNIYPKKSGRKILSLKEEQEINETSNCRVIGLTLETRPDGINHESIHFLRKLGVTRMQIGIQHTNNRLLKKINRGHTIEDSINAIKLLKDSGLKIIAHLMPDLPGTTEQEDIEMFNRILNDSDLLCDEFKIYPCVVPKTIDESKPVTTVIERWARQGKYIPNADKDPEYLSRVIGHYMKNVQPWVRVPRIIRDIPNTYITHGNKDGHLRQVIDKNNPHSQEIRLREIKRGKLTELPVLIIDKFQSSKFTEYFIRYETADRKKILGFCRLRLGDPDNSFLPELYNSAIIRELHVYGKVTIVDKKSKGVQHLGLGQKMVRNAEWIALKNGYGEMCITSGIGVRQYYKNKLGYHLEGMYMKKNILLPIIFKVLFSIIVIGFLCVIYLCIY